MKFKSVWMSFRTLLRLVLILVSRSFLSSRTCSEIVAPSTVENVWASFCPFSMAFRAASMSTAPILRTGRLYFWEDHAKRCNIDPIRRSPRDSPATEQSFPLVAERPVLLKKVTDRDFELVSLSQENEIVDPRACIVRSSSA